MSHTERPQPRRRDWSSKVVWALLSFAAPLFAAAAFLAFEAARGAARGFSIELALAALFGLVLPLAVVAAARRRNAWPGPMSTLFTYAAGAIGAVLFLFAGLVSWLG